VQEAQRLVPDFEAHPKNGKGKISRVKFEALEQVDVTCELCGDKVTIDRSAMCGAVAPYSLGESDMVLCRVNAPLVGLAFRMLKAGKRVNIKGRDIGARG
jgi:hypothetical protein